MTQPANFMGTVESVPVNLPPTPAAEAAPAPIPTVPPAAPVDEWADAPSPDDILGPPEPAASPEPAMDEWADAPDPSAILGPAAVTDPWADAPDPGLALDDWKDAPDPSLVLDTPGPTMTAGQAFMATLPRGLTFGFSDELEGGVAYLLDKYYGTSDANMKLAKQGIKVSGPLTSEDAYNEAVSTARARLKAAEEQHPLASFAGMVTGGLLVPGVGALGAFSSAGVKGAMLAGGIEGAIAGVGESTAKLLPDELTVDEIKQVASDAAMGGALGTLGVGALSLAGKGISKVIGKSVKAPTTGLTAAETADIETQAFQAVIDNKDNINAVADLIPKAKITGDDIADFDTFARAMDIDDDTAKFVKDSVKHEASAAKAWEEPTSFTINEDFMRSLGTNTIEDTEATLLKMAEEVDPVVKLMGKLKSEGKEAEALKVAAYVKYKSDMEGFIDWLQPRTVNTIGKSADTTVSVAEKADYARRQGMLNGKMYKAYKVAKEVEKAASEKLKTSFGVDDPVNNLNGFEDLKYVLRRIDDKLGIGLEPAADSIAHGVANYKDFAIREDNALKKLAKTAHKAGLDGESLTRALDAGEDSEAFRATLTATQQEAVTSARKYLDTLRVKFNDLGLPVDKIENYIPHSMKRGADLIIAVRDKVKELGGPKLLSMTDASFDSAFHKSGDWTAEELAAVSSDTRSLVELKTVMERLFNTEFSSAASLKQAASDLFDNKRMAAVRKKALGFEATASMARKGILPEWAREKDFERLVRNMMVNGAKAVFVNPELKVLEAYIPVLRMAKYKDSAKYITNYISDMSGAASRKIGVIQDAALRYELWAKTALKGAPQDVALLAPHMLSMLSQQIYPNLLGLNLKGIMDNALAPFVSGASGLASASSSGVIPYAYKQTLKAYAEVAADQALTVGKTFNIVKAVFKAEKDLKAAGFAQPGITPKDIEGLREPIRRGLIGAGVRATDALTSTSMWMFNHSEILSKFTAMKTIDKIADDFFSGLAKSKAGQVLTKNEARAQEAIAAFPRSIRRRAMMMPEKEARHVLRQHYINQNSLVYGKAGASEFARDWGNVLAMLSKWPVSTGADIIYTMQSQPANKAAMILAQKYMYPYIALGTIGSIISGQSKQSEVRMDEVFGKGGPQGRTPIASVIGLKDFGKTPIVQSGFGILDAASGAADMAVSPHNSAKFKEGKRKLKKAANDSIKLYAPWTVWKRGYEHLKSLRTGRKFRFDEEK